MCATRSPASSARPISSEVAFRVAACAAEFEDERSAETLADLEALGLLPVDAPHPLAVIDAHDSDPGVTVSRHPERLLDEHPRLWPIIDRFLTGAVMSVTAELWRSASSFEVDCVMTLAAARARDERRAYERSRTKAED